MDFFARVHITLTAELSVLELFLKLSTEDMLVRASVDAERNHASCKLFLASHFSILSERKFLKKGSLTKTCREFVTLLALLLLC
jgi:hypothetical protein